MKWFTIPELSDSATARARGIPNVPGAEAEASLRALAEEVLDPLREAWGAPIYVNSGYRCPRLNFIGQAQKSHLEKEYPQ